MTTHKDRQNSGRIATNFMQLRVALLPLLVLALGLAVPSVAKSQDRPEPSPATLRAELEPGALKWIRDHLKPFASDVPSSKELATLTEMIGEAKIVGFGEVTHGDHQSQLFKSHAIRELVRQGAVSALMLEVNREAGAEVDAYINQGKGDLTKIILDSGVFSIWKTDDFASLVGWLRGYVVRTGKPFRVFGIDCQDASVDLQFALERLRRKDRKAADRFTKELQPLLDAEKDGSDLITWINGQKPEAFKLYEEIVSRLIEAAKKTKDPEAIYAAKVARQCLLAYQYEFGGEAKDFSKLPADYWSRRDVFMSENLLELNGSLRSALWAHDMHVLGSLPDYVSQTGYQTLGMLIRKAIGKGYVSVTFAWTKGSFRARLWDPSVSIVEARSRPFEAYEVSCDKPGDLGEFLARVGPERFMVDFRKADEATHKWGAIPYYRGWCGWGLNPKEWLTRPGQESSPTLPVTDILVFYKAISPSTVWQLPKKD